LGFAGLGGFVLAAPVELPKFGDVSVRQPVEIRSRELLFERGDGMTKFSGDVQAIHGSMLLRADEIWATSGNRQATAEGHVSAIDNSMAATLTCGHLEYRDLMGIITAHDDPLLTSVDDKGNPVTLVSRQMEFYSEQKKAVANQSVVMTSLEGYARAQKATLLQDRGEIFLEGEPHVFTTQGDFSGRLLKMDLKENKFEADGSVEVNFYPTPLSQAPAPSSAEPTGGRKRSGSPSPSQTPSAGESGNQAVPTAGSTGGWQSKEGTVWESKAGGFSGGIAATPAPSPLPPSGIFQMRHR